MRYVKFILSAFIALFVSCLELPEDVNLPAEKVLSVSALLQNDVAEQRLYLYRGGAVSDTSNPDIFRVSGADVRLSVNGLTYNYTESDTSKGCYVLENFSPQGKTLYRLIVNHPSFPQIRAETLYPAIQDFNWSYFFDSEGNLHLSWRKNAYCAGYRVDMYQWKYGFHNGWEEEYFWGSELYYFTPDTFLIIEEKALLYQNRKVDLKFFVFAVDKNYYDYSRFRTYFDPLDFRLVDYGNFSTVENGLGYFGSAYRDSLIITRNK